MSDRAIVSEGVDAFFFGEPLSDCPYAEGTRERALWLDGWEEARYDTARQRAFDLDRRYVTLMQASRNAPRSRNL